MTTARKACGSTRARDGARGGAEPTYGAGMTALDSPIPRFHLAMPVDDIAAARTFYGEVLGLAQGRSAETWVDWNLDGHEVPVPHFGLILTIDRFHELAERLRAAEVTFVIEPYVRFEGQPGEQWTMFLLDPAGNALEFKAFADDSQVFAT